MDKNSVVEVAQGGNTNELLQQGHYYPFGMGIRGEWKFVQPQVGGVNQYQYNGKELNDDYGARWYDMSIARWNSIDPLGEKYLSWSGYNYVLGNPLRFIDPDGLEPKDPPIFIFEGFGENTEEIRQKVISAFENMRHNGPENVRQVMNTIANGTDEYGNKLQVTIKACPDICLSPSVPPVSSINNVTILWPNSDILERVAYEGEQNGTWVADNFTATFGNELKHVYDYFTGRVWTQEQAVAAIMEGREDEIPQQEFIIVPGTNEKLDVLELESNLFTNDIRKWLGLPLERTMTHVGGEWFESTKERDIFIKKII